MNVVAMTNRFSRAVYDRERSHIEETYGKNSVEAGAKRDQQRPQQCCQRVIRQLRVEVQPRAVEKMPHGVHGDIGIVPESGVEAQAQPGHQSHCGGAEPQRLQQSASAFGIVAAHRSAASHAGTAP